MVRERKQPVKAWWGVALELVEKPINIPEAELGGERNQIVESRKQSAETKTDPVRDAEAHPCGVYDECLDVRCLVEHFDCIKLP